jgi:aspartate ammonia-lyase
MRLAALLLLDEVLDALVALKDSFARKGREFDRVLKAGRTHMMDAVPIRLGQEFAAYSTAMKRCAVLLQQAQELLANWGSAGRQWAR